MVLRPTYAIYSIPSFGPTFGHGWDIYISDNANSNNDSYANFASGGFYESPKGVQDVKTILAGTYYFSPDDWEVFYLGWNTFFIHITAIKSDLPDWDSIGHESYPTKTLYILPCYFQ